MASKLYKAFKYNMEQAFLDNPKSRKLDADFYRWHINQTHEGQREIYSKLQPYSAQLGDTSEVGESEKVQIAENLKSMKSNHVEKLFKSVTLMKKHLESVVGFYQAFVDDYPNQSDEINRDPYWERLSNMVSKKTIEDYLEQYSFSLENWQNIFEVVAAEKLFRDDQKGS